MSLESRFVTKTGLVVKIEIKSYEAILQFLYDYLTELGLNIFKRGQVTNLIWKAGSSQMLVMRFIHAIVYNLTSHPTLLQQNSISLIQEAALKTHRQPHEIHTFPFTELSLRRFELNAPQALTDARGAHDDDSAPAGTATVLQWAGGLPARGH